MEEAPEAVRQAAAKLAEAFDAQIDQFGDKFVEFVRTANEEVTRSIAEVVRAVREARTEGAEQLDDLEQVVGTALGRLGAVDGARWRRCASRSGSTLRSSTPELEVSARRVSRAAPNTSTPLSSRDGRGVFVAVGGSLGGGSGAGADVRFQLVVGRADVDHFGALDQPLGEVRADVPVALEADELLEERLREGLAVAVLVELHLLGALPALSKRLARGKSGEAAGGGGGAASRRSARSAIASSS